MNYKKIAGFLSLVIGIVLLCYGFYGVHRMIEAKKDINTVSGFVSEKVVKNIFREKAYDKVDSYKLPVTLCFIGSFAFLGAGGVVIYLSYKQKK